MRAVRGRLQTSSHPPLSATRSATASPWTSTSADSPSRTLAVGTGGLITCSPTGPTWRWRVMARHQPGRGGRPRWPRASSASACRDSSWRRRSPRTCGSSLATRRSHSRSDFRLACPGTPPRAGSGLSSNRRCRTCSSATTTAKRRSSTVRSGIQRPRLAAHQPRHHRPRRPRRPFGP